MSVNIWAVLVAAVAQFIIGAIWYTPIFGRVWVKIHSFDKLKPATQKEMQKQMMPLLVWQFIASVVTAYVLAHFIKTQPEVVWWHLALWVWLGFMVTTQVGAVLFGGTEPKWITTKLAIMAGGSLACTLAAAAILSAWQ